MRQHSIWLMTLATLSLATPARADRVQVFSVQGVYCGNCEEEIRPFLKKVKGVKSWKFDEARSEFKITLADNVPDQAIVEAFERQGCYRAIPGPGKGAKSGAYKDAPYPPGADFALVTDKGEAVGSLEKLRVPGKYTVLDFYADWCGPCHKIDKRLREIVADRKDVAVRKLNIVHFESPLAKELGRKLRGLPYLIVFAPDGKRTEILGENPKQLDRALKVRT